MDLLDIWSILFIYLFCFLEVLIHEIGHYTVARYYGVTVLTVSIGCGLRVFGWREPENGTLFIIKLFPLSGYNRFLTEGSMIGKHASRAETVTHQPRRVRIKITLAGVAANLVFGTAALLVGRIVTDTRVALGCNFVCFLSVLDVCVNLLPVRGLDGATLLYMLRKKEAK